MTRWLRLALVAQVVFFAGWGATLLASHEGAGIVWLATEPVDPRDLLSGHFVALRYPVASADAVGCGDLDAGSAVYVQLREGDTVLATADGPVRVWDAVRCQTVPPSWNDGEHWMIGTFDPEHGPRHITYGIERFYVPETSPLRTARSGTVVAKVAINDRLDARLVDLVPIVTTTD